MKGPFLTVFFAGCCFFALWVVIAGSPTDRITRACAPTSWVGTMITSIASVFGAGAEQRSSTAMREMNVTCKYLVFRQFYAEDLARARAEAEAAKSAGQGDEPAEAGR